MDVSRFQSCEVSKWTILEKLLHQSSDYELDGIFFLF